MRAIYLSLLCAALALLAAVPAQARPIMIEDDRYVPQPPPPPTPPPPPPRRPPREAAIAAVSALGMSARGRDGALDRLGGGVGLSLGWMNFRHGVGLQADALFIDGVEGSRFYDLGFSFLAQVPLVKRFTTPFVAVGLDVGAVGKSEASTRAPGMAIGVHANAGVHGLISERIYWRVRGGFVGGAMSGLETSIALGYRFDH